MPKANAPISAAIADAETVPLAPESVQHTPDQWLARLFHVSASGRPHPDEWKHHAASALHQWRVFEAATGQAPLLDQPTYLAALEAASGNAFIPHPAADYTARRKG